MSLLKGKIAQRSAAALGAVALIGAVALPTTVMGQSITLNRCPANGTGGPTTTCISQIAVPVQVATQTGTIDPSISNAQSADVSQSASNRNRANQIDVNAQAQKNIQV